MFWRLVLIGIAATLAQGAELTGPSEFYVVSVFFSDNGALFDYRVTEVKQDGHDTLIRYARVGWTNPNCPRLIVQAAKATAPNTSLAELVKDNNPCAVKPSAVRSELKKHARRAGVFEAISFGIVAQCSSSSVSFELPDVQGVNLKSMGRSHPEIVRLWSLASDITDYAFGAKDIFHDRTEVDDLALQLAGEKLVPELVSGRYDVALATAVKGNGGDWHSPSFRSLLAGYGGPISMSEAKASYVTQLVNADAYRFSNFAAPKYPPLAMQARIQGKIDLQLTVEPGTGEVRSVSALSGHPLLKPSAIDAARLWRFAPNSVDSETITATLDFALRCP